MNFNFTLRLIFQKYNISHHYYNYTNIKFYVTKKSITGFTENKEGFTCDWRARVFSAKATHYIEQSPARKHTTFKSECSKNVPMSTHTVKLTCSDVGQLLFSTHRGLISTVRLFPTEVSCSKRISGVRITSAYLACTT